MEKVTTLLRQARESKNVSLNEAGIATHVPLRYLQVLEGGEERILLADRMYLVPYLRTYATFLGLNAAIVVNQFVTELQAPQVPEEAARSQFLPAPSSSRFSSLTIPSLLLFAVLGIFSFVSRQDESDSPEPSEKRAGTSPSFPSPPASLPAPPEASTAPPAPLPSSPMSPFGTETVQPLPIPTAPSTPSPTTLVSSQPASPSVTASHLLKVRAKEKTWLRVSIDGQQPPKDVLLEPGQETEWSAQQGFVLTLGNAGGIHITLDGEDLPPPGKPGQVIRDLRLPAPPGATPQAIPVIIPVTTSVATSVVTPAASSPPQKRPSPPKVKVRDEATDLQRILDGLKRVRKDIRG